MRSSYQRQETGDLRNSPFKRLCKVNQFPKLRLDYGTGWVGPGLTSEDEEFVLVENCPKPVLKCWSKLLVIMI